MLKTEHYTLVSGVGYGDTALNAFDNALCCAGVGDYNLIKVSSIWPAMSNEEKNVGGVPGGILPIAYGSKIGNEEGVQIVAAVAVGIPEDPKEIGVIMEYSGLGNDEQAEFNVKKMVQEAMRNRNIKIKEIKCITSSCIVSSKFCCAFAGIALW